MSTEINKTSISYTASSFIDKLKKYVINPNEAINEEPSSYVSLFTSTLAKTSAYSYFNMLMSKRELTPSTAILMKSLMRQLPSDSINSIYGKPSSLDIVISYPESDIINNAVYQGNNKYKLTLNKGAIFNISNYPQFTFDFNIDIFVTKYMNNGKSDYSIYAMYDVNDKEAGNIITVTNPYIVSRNDIIINDKKHFTMYIPLKQFTRNYSINEMSGEAKNINIPYTGNLMGFVVLYRSQGSNIYTTVPANLEGENRIDGVSYSLNESNGAKSIRIKFSKLPNSFNPTNGIIEIVYYTTAGADGNFDLGQVDENTLSDLSIEYNQNISYPEQEGLVNLIPTITITGTSASGGENAKDIEGVRKLVESANKGEVITPTTLSYKATENGFSVYKKRHDLISFEYMLSSFIKTENSVIPTKMIDGYFNESYIPLDLESNSRIIKPSYVFRKDKNSNNYNILKSEDSGPYTDYYEKYNNSEDTDYSFPYFIRIQNGANPNVTVYDESLNENKSTKFSYLSPSILDKTSIVSLNCLRNALSKETYVKNGETKYIKDAYQFNFEVNTSEYIVDHLANLDDGEEPYVKFRLIFKNRTDNGAYAADAVLESIGSSLFSTNKSANMNVLKYSTKLETTSNLLSNGKINICNNSIKSIPLTNSQSNFYYIDGNIDVEIVVIFKRTVDSTLSGSSSSSYNKYLTDDEINKGYYVGIVYSVEDIYLAKDMNKNVNIVPDIKLSQPVYETADEDTPDTYKENEYKVDANGNYVMEEQSIVLPDGTTSTTNSFVLLHKAGDTKKEVEGCVGTYNTLSVSTSWKWSNKGISESEIYTDGMNVLGGKAIYCMVQWNNLVIFGGADGRIACYDITHNSWHSYNTQESYRNGNENNGYLILNDGSALGFGEVRGLTVVKNQNNSEILLAFGEGGRVASCDLSSNTWRSYDGNGGNSTAIYYNNGSCTGAETLYDSVDYSNSDKETVVVFGGGKGRMCCLNVNTNTWYNYDYDKTKQSRNYIFSDGEERNYNAIISMSKYIESSIYCTGINGCSSIVDLTNGEIALLNDGSVVDNQVMYASGIYGNYFIEAGKNGYVASYNIIKSSWNIYNAGIGLCSDGVHMGGENIYDILVYGTNIIFAGGEGRICSYENTSNKWESYNDGSGLSSDGSFINNTISCMSYDTSKGNALIYFGGSVGNITYKYKKGDIKYDNNGNPIIKSGSKQVIYLKGIPAFSRIFAVSSTYNTVSDLYTEMIEKVNNMSNIFVDGCSLHVGVKTTSGDSKKFYFVDSKTDNFKTLSSLALSMRLGIKFESNITKNNQEYIIDIVKSEIEKYVFEIQENTSSEILEFNILGMLDNIKNNVSGIEYFEYYGLNDYDSSECQTIFCSRAVDDTENEYLCIRSKIDEELSDISNEYIEFEPDISITIL